MWWISYLANFKVFFCRINVKWTYFEPFQVIINENKFPKSGMKLDNLYFNIRNVHVISKCIFFAYISLKLNFTISHFNSSVRCSILIIFSYCWSKITVANWTSLFVSLKAWTTRSLENPISIKRFIFSSDGSKNKELKWKNYIN